MRINNNITAMNAHLQLGKNSSKKTKSTEKLSSGFRINRSADDAAGLAISEKMRAQIRGLNQASRNIGDGISLVQTAEGGMQEIHNVMQRCRELTVQALSDTNDTEVDRPAIQQELDQLVREIDHTAGTTTFNSIPLLTNPAKEELVSKRPPADVVIVFDLSGSMSTALATVKSSLSTMFDNMPEGSRAGFVFFAGENEHFSHIDLSGDVEGLQDDIAGINANEGGAGEVGLKGINKAIELLKSSANPYKKIIYVSDEADVNSGHFPEPLTAEALNESMRSNGIEFYGCGTTSGAQFNQMAALAAGTGGGLYDYTNLSGLTDGTFTETQEVLVSEQAPPDPLWIQSGANQNDGVWINTYDCRAKTLGVDPLIIDPRDQAEQSLMKLDHALNTVSTYRADAGAKQNRLEHSLRNVENTAENLAAAESRIRDVDMAQEMAEYVKYDILSQSATAILAQANQQPQTVLQLIS